MDGGGIKTLIVDTNIVFSILLRKNSPLGDFLFQAESEYKIKLVAPEFIRTELSRHLSKAVRLTGLSKTECELRIAAILNRIEIISEQIIPVATFAQAAAIVREVDVNDVAFVATSMHYRAPLFTGDRALYRGLLSKGYMDVVTFSELQTELNIE